MSKSRIKPLTVIEGGKAELERKKRLLFSQPWIFSHDEFDRLCETFGLSRAEAFDLATERVRYKARSSYEAAAVLAIFEGGAPFEILAMGRRKCFRVETSSPPSLPRSSAPGGADRS